MTLVDSSVLIDILSNDPRWSQWCYEQMLRRHAVGPLLINEVIYAEASVGIATEAAMEKAIAALRVSVQSTPRTALFLAGRAFLRYRRAGGLRTGVLPDFFIGAQATVARIPLLTRDPKHYRAYFPSVTLIAPEA